MSNGTTTTLGEIAALIGATLEGDPSLTVTGLQTLEKASPTCVSFLANARYSKYLKATKAAAVIVDSSAKADCPVAALVMDNPYLGYAQLSQFFSIKSYAPCIHHSACIDQTAIIAPTASVGPNVVIGANAKLAEHVVIEANSVIGENCDIGEASHLAPNVTVYDGVSIGKRAVIHSAAVIGADGFGFAPAKGRWHKIAQLGAVQIGDDVEIGAGTTIDRGALEDTVIGNGVKLDNQIQIAHNVTVGDDSAFAGCVGVAGSSKIGRRCTLGGGVVVAGHLELADDVHVTAMGLVTKSIDAPGVYSSGTGMQENKQWKRNVVRFRQLDQMSQRLSALEKVVSSLDQAED